MKEYLFILGRDPELSILELIAHLQKNNIKFHIKETSKTGAVLSLEGNFNPKLAIKQLGGIVKIGELLENLEGVYQGSKNKIKYAISVYEKVNINKAYDKIKRYFKEQNLKAFYKKPKRERALMPSEVIKQKLLEKGVEFIIYKEYLARTVAVFNPFEHEKRDEEMPCKDYIKTISIRLAKILINLSQSKNLLLDPFCGHGVILQEAILQGINVVGIDVDITSVESSKRNIAFIEKKYGTKAKHEVLQGDSRRLSRLVKDADGIATEPYMGPYLKRLPSIEQAQDTMARLEDLYRRVLEDAKKTVKGKIAIIVPRFQTKQRTEVTMNFSKMITELGYKTWQPTKQISIPVIYPHGRLIREIWVLEA